jgi:protein TonB
MFEQSLIESSGRLKTRRPLTTIISFALQVLIVGLLVLIPLLVTQALPTTQLTTMLVAPPPPPPPPPPPAAAAVPAHVAKTEPINPNTLQTPVKIPEKVKIVHDQPEIAGAASASTMAGVVGGVPGGTPGGQLGGVIGGVLNSTGTAMPKMEQKLRVSQGVSEGLLVKKVMPEYPAMAKQARIQGAVVLQAEISKDGQITNVQVLQGPPMLAAAAVDAVKQWRYRPYNLNGQPVPIETTITVNFRLNS